MIKKRNETNRKKVKNEDEIKMKRIFPSKLTVLIIPLSAVLKKNTVQFSVADLEDFCPDPDPIFFNGSDPDPALYKFCINIRIQTQQDPDPQTTLA
jgi:hypothetical protein